MDHRAQFSAVNIALFFSFALLTVWLLLLKFGALFSGKPAEPVPAPAQTLPPMEAAPAVRVTPQAFDPFRPADAPDESPPAIPEKPEPPDE